MDPKSARVRWLIPHVFLDPASPRKSPPNYVAAPDLEVSYVTRHCTEKKRQALIRGFLFAHASSQRSDYFTCSLLYLLFSFLNGPLADFTGFLGQAFVSRRSIFLIRGVGA